MKDLRYKNRGGGREPWVGGGGGGGGYYVCGIYFCGFTPICKHSTVHVEWTIRTVEVPHGQLVTMTFREYHILYILTVISVHRQGIEFPPPPPPPPPPTHCACARFSFLLGPYFFRESSTVCSADLTHHSFSQAHWQQKIRI